jgi:hypothetical protein
MSPSDERRLAKLETDVTRLCTLVESDLRQSHARLRKLEAHLYGTPEAGVPGVVVDLDRVKGSAARSNRLQWLIASVVVVFIVERVLALL